MQGENHIVAATSVRVKTFPGARKEKFFEVKTSEQHSDILQPAQKLLRASKNVRMFEAYVREPAQKNLANTRVRELVADYFGVALSSVAITKGHRSRNKLLEIK